MVIISIVLWLNRYEESPLPQIKQQMRWLNCNGCQSHQPFQQHTPLASLKLHKVNKTATKSNGHLGPGLELTFVAQYLSFIVITTSLDNVISNKAKQIRLKVSNSD